MNEYPYEIHEIYELFKDYPRLCTDSRKLIPDSIFFALKGANFDGNSFVEQALQQGCAFALTDDPAMARIPGSIFVNDVQTALQQLAALHRRMLAVPMLMITGTNGKTTTKELTKAVLLQKYSITATEGNLNNHIGLPITLLGMNDNTQFAVIEAGANHLGEIATLCNIAAPNYGLITNVGKAHLEGFGSFDGVKTAKSELYDYLQQTNGMAFFNADDHEIVSMIDRHPNLRRTAYGASLLQAVGTIAKDLRLTVNTRNPEMNISTQMAGQYNLNNILAATAVGLYFGIDIQSIANAIEGFRPADNRSQLITDGENTVIMDAYNANPSSMTAAVNNFAALEGKKIAILGDMLELGNEADREHRSILELADSKELKQIMLVGQNFAAAAKTVKVNTPLKVFKNKEDILNYLRDNPPKGFTILVKASHGIALDALDKVLLSN
jgi:UDP-N-acetylmuramoyl-tripeptide--D-alanyl-D-alanine ligase